MTDKSIKDRPLEKSKISRIKKLMDESFKEHNFMRLLFPVRHVNKENKETVFSKIGSQPILDRAFLVNQEGLKTHWVYEPLGKDFGRSIALSEITFIIREILKCEDDCIKEVLTKKLDQETIREYIKTSGTSFDSIITSINIHKEFFYMSEFKFLKDRKIPFCDGTIFGLKVFRFSSMPENKIFFINSKNFAEILEKEKLHLKIFEKLDEKKVLKVLPKLKNTDLAEKISILFYEIIGFKINNPKELLIIEHKK